MAVSAWKILDSRYILRDRWITLRADRCLTAGGLVVDPYYVEEPQDWIQVIAFDARDRILLTRQYRHAAGLLSIELPCGCVEPGETPLQAAARELLEETGCTSASMQALPVLFANPARATNRIHAFVATDTRQTQPQRLDETEVIDFEFRTVAEVLALIDSGSFPQALHVANLFLALRLRGLIPT
jgi:8-oxo-dGTP pyrophosphatase MutT (NUDIX family)